MAMKDWIHFLALQNADNKDVSSKSELSTLYLKDWHLQKILEDKGLIPSYQNKSTIENAPKKTANEEETTHICVRILNST